MSQTEYTAVTRLLLDLQRGDRQVVDDLFPLVYDELHRLAQFQRRGWQGDYTVNATALVHEAYLKLVDQSQASYEGRAHFMAIASKAMRHILIDYAKRRRAQKRGGEVQKLSLDEMRGSLGDGFAVSDDRIDTLVALDDALERLARVSERESRIVECRFFGEMTIEETAAALGISPATVKRGWAMAQAWLYDEIQGADHDG